MSMHKTLINLVENRISTSLEENEITISKKNIDVMIIGHGSMDPNAQMSLNYVVDGLKEKYRNASRCFLEIEQPDIFEGIKECEKNTPEVLVVVFYFLHEGAHVKTDINNDLKPALEKSNIKKVCITKHLGVDKKMIDLILERAKEVENAN
jgi:sirohydrochlorin ferrochelatase